MAQGHASGQSTVPAIIGFAIGIILVLLGFIALSSSARGFGQGLADWGVGYGLVGVLILAAGCAAIVGTWWHRTRVVGRHH
ncbi:MAG TPA: hypothetical protein VKZ58_05450 [Longimicrobiales bacterium]|nr:hypothetical protein [Longimicrobiales bacterium]